MSDDDGLSWDQWRGLILFGVLFAGLFVYSLFDLLFLSIGRTGTATVSETWVTSSRRSRVAHMEFKFKDSAGNERTAKAVLGDMEPPEAGTEFEIQYLPMWLLDSVDAARPKQSFNWFRFGLLSFFALGFGFFAYRAIYHPPS